MAQERDTINLTNNVKIDTTNREELEIRIARVLERGMLSERLQVELPDGMYGEWVADDPVEIYRMKSMGFEEDIKYATASALHTDGSGRAKVGDTIFMTAPRLVKDVIDSVSRKKYEQSHGKKKTEEEKYTELINMQGTPVINKSNSQVVDGKDISMSMNITQ